MTRIGARLKYKKPNLRGHNVLYKGRRYWAFEVSSEFSYEGSEDIDSIVVYDGSLETDVAWCHQEGNGVFKGFAAYGMHELSVSGSTIEELISDVDRVLKWSINH